MDADRRLGRVTRAEVEDLLFHEAALLDEWKLEEWAALLADDVRYLVPPTDQPDAAVGSALFLVADDATRLRSRVQQLLGKSAWSESPPSRTRRLITNVRILALEADSLRVTANFAIYRSRHYETVSFVGRYEHVLVERDGALRILERRAILDHEALRPHGKVSIIL